MDSNLVVTIYKVLNPSSEKKDDECDKSVPGEARKSCSVRLKYVEPALFLSALSTSIFDVVSTDVIELQYCSSVLHIYDRNVCLNREAPHFTNMQKYLSNFLMYQMIGTSIFPAIASVFLGPWSDAYGRRPLLLWCSFAISFIFYLMHIVHATKGAPESKEDHISENLHNLFNLLLRNDPKKIIEYQTNLQDILVERKEECAKIRTELAKTPAQDRETKLIENLATETILEKNYEVRKQGRIFTVSLWIWGSNKNIHPDYFLLFDAPFALTGGAAVNWLAAFCYTCDVTTTEVRAFRLGVMIGVFNVASLVGILTAPHIRNISYTCTLAVSAIGSLITFLYILIFLKESVFISKTQRKLVSKNPFHWSHVKSIYESCYVKQHLNVFKILVYVGLFQSLSSIQFTGENTVFYLFLQNALDWNVEKFTHLLAIMLLVHALAACLGTSETLGLADLEIVNLTVGIRLLSALTFCFGQQNWLVYVTTSLTSSGGIGVTVIKNFLSKIIHADDIGKVFALTGLLEALTGAPIGSPIYNMVYKQTMDTFPKAVFLVSAFLCLLMALLTARIVNFCLRLPNGLEFVKSSSILSTKIDENENVMP